jgi:hypothetical protein
MYFRLFYFLSCILLAICGNSSQDTDYCKILTEKYDSFVSKNQKLKLRSFRVTEKGYHYEFLDFVSREDAQYTVTESCIQQKFNNSSNFVKKVKIYSSSYVSASWIYYYYCDRNYTDTEVQTPMEAEFSLSVDDNDNKMFSANLNITLLHNSSQCCLSGKFLEPFSCKPQCQQCGGTEVDFYNEVGYYQLNTEFNKTFSNTKINTMNKDFLTILQ